MNLRFTNWYTQAIGGTLGIMACLYSYLNGDMITYGNIETYFDVLGFGSLISSYLLLPLCIITLLLAVIKSYASNKSFFKVSIENMNIVIIIATVIIGFMGAKIYFVIPAIFILFNLFTYFKTQNASNNQIFSVNDRQHKKDIKHEKHINYEDSKKKESTLVYREESLKGNNISYKNKPNKKTNESQTLRTKIEMAKELIEKNAQKQFIIEVTGLTLQQLKIIENELKNRK